jgi:acyl dehydratase
MTLTRTITAFNTATASENRIHDDATAAKFGFTGGLVPGVDDFAYMQHGPVKLFGREWLSEGGMRAKFLAPIYDGDEATLEATILARDELVLKLTSRGQLCGDGSAVRRIEGEAPEIPPRGRHPDEDKRPKASMASLPVGLVLGYPLEPYTQADGAEHLEHVREDADLYDGGRICNPGWMLRRANYILMANVMLGPWIHYESDVRLHGLLVDGQTADVRAVVVDNYDRKGHLTVALDFAVLADGEPKMSGRHVAIYEPRQVRGL